MSDWLYLELFVVGCFLGVADKFVSEAKASKWMIRVIVFVLGAGVVALFSAFLINVSGKSPSLVRLLFRIGKGSNLIFAGVVVAGWICWKLMGSATAIRSAKPVFLARPVLLGARLLIAGYFAVTGVGYLLQRDRSYLFFQRSGYSYPFFIFIATAEFAGALGMLIPGLARWAAIGLSLDMIGAIYTHFHNHIVWGAVNPLSNSLDALKILPVLALIVFAGAKNERPARNGRA